MDLNTTVEEYLYVKNHCSRTLLFDLAREKEYWENAKDFVEDNMKNTVASLSKQMRNWLFRIKDDLLEEASR